MKNQKEIFINKPTAKDYLVVLNSFPNFIQLLDRVDKPYEKIIDCLLKNGAYFNSEESIFQSVKALSLTLDINQTKLSKNIKMLYDDILELNAQQPQLFCKPGQIKCDLTFKYLGNYICFTLGLNVIPRIGEYFEFHFIRPKIGTSGFFVKNISNHYDYKGHSITIGFSTSFENLYLKLLKEKAYLHNYISLYDFLDDDISDEMEEKLKKWYRDL